MGKKFIEKKKSATFQLLARDSSDPNYDQGPSGDRVFVRVDNNPYSLDDFGDDEEEDPHSIFADALEEQVGIKPNGDAPLPDSVRREVLELGFPDDGYNYLLHLREIKNTGGGSAYYENSKAKLDQLSLDVKAYDASRVRVSLSADDNDSNNSIYRVAASTVGVRVNKAIDPEVEALLDDNDDDLSRFGSDVDDLEEDFVMQANLPEEEDNENVIVDNKIDLLNGGHPITFDDYSSGECKYELIRGDESRSHQLDAESEYVDEKPRARRLLDEQFDLLTMQEYGTESDSDHDGSLVAEDECLAVKLNHVLKDRAKDDLDLDGRYKVPADLLHENEGSNNDEVVESAAAVIRRCAEYGKMYDDENQCNDEVVILEESSDEDEVWDCETIVTTYSNLDNHPGKIGAPGGIGRKKKLAETVSAASGDHISLRGKEKLPLDYLPRIKKDVVDKKTSGLASSQQKSRPRDGESKEEKKARKDAVKEERREARQAKKEMKSIYRCEAQRAQKVAAVSGPHAIHLA